MPKKLPVPMVPPVPAGYTPGAEIKLEAVNDLLLAVDLHGTHYCYLGYCPPDGRQYGQFYHLSVASRERVNTSDSRFARLHHGMIFLDSFLSSYGHYRVVKDRRVSMPSGADSYYGVRIAGSYEEDETLTRELFGATYDELQAFLPAFSSATDETPYPNSKTPRVTFSRSRDNDCDLTKALIPQEFPFIALEDTTIFKGHMSLGGMFRLLTFLCMGFGAGAPGGNETYRRLIKCGADKMVLDRLIKAGAEGYRLPLIRTH